MCLYDWGKGKVHRCVRCMDRGTHLPEFGFRFSGSNVLLYRLHNIRHNVELFIYSVVSYLLQGPLEYIFMAATSKLVAASATYPYQVIRARLQVSRPK